MVVNWMEWSDGLHTMHRNEPGMAEDTYLGFVRPTADGCRWETADGTINGTATYVDEAKRQLMRALGGKEVDPYA